MSYKVREEPVTVRVLPLAYVSQGIYVHSLFLNTRRTLMSIMKSPEKTAAQCVDVKAIAHVIHTTKKMTKSERYYKHTLNT